MGVFPCAIMETLSGIFSQPYLAGVVTPVKLIKIGRQVEGVPHVFETSAFSLFLLAQPAVLHAK